MLSLKRPNISLTNSDLRNKLNSTMKENKPMKRKLQSTTKQLSEESERKSITLDDTLDRNFRSVVEIQKDTAKTSYMSYLTL